MAKTSRVRPEVFDSLCRAAAAKVKDFNAQSLANTVDVCTTSFAAPFAWERLGPSPVVAAQPKAPTRSLRPGPSSSSSAAAPDKAKEKAPASNKPAPVSYAAAAAAARGRAGADVGENRAQPRKEHQEPRQQVDQEGVEGRMEGELPGASEEAVLEVDNVDGASEPERTPEASFETQSERALEAPMMSSHAWSQGSSWRVLLEASSLLVQALWPRQFQASLIQASWPEQFQASWRCCQGASVKCFQEPSLGVQEPSGSKHGNSASPSRFHELAAAVNSSQPTVIKITLTMMRRG